MSNEKTQQCKGLFVSLLAKFQATQVPCLFSANFTVLQCLNNSLPTAIFSCKALVSQLMAYKNSALLPDDKTQIHAFIVKILFTFMAFQDNADQKTLVEMLIPLFPESQDEKWDNLLVNLQKMTATELPSSQNVQAVSTSPAGYQAFIQTLLQFKTQARLLPFNETLIVSLLIAGAEKAQTFAKLHQKSALSFTDEDEIKAFIQQKFDSTSCAVLLELYAFSLLKSRFIDFLQKKFFPLVEKLKALKEALEVKANLNLKILEQVDTVENYKAFSTQFTLLQEQTAALSKEYETIQTEANDCLKNPELLKNADLIPSIEKKLAAIAGTYETLEDSIKLQQEILDQRIGDLTAEKQKAYQELTENFGQFNRESNEFLSQVIAIKLAFNRANEAKLIPLTQKDDPSYDKKIASVVEKFALIGEKIESTKSFQTQQSTLVASKTSVPEFAKCPLVQQYQTYAEFAKAFEALKKAFSESPLALSNPTGELKEIKTSFANQIGISQQKLEKDRGELKKLGDEKASLDKDKMALHKAIVDIFAKKLDETISESESFVLLDKKVSDISLAQKNLDKSHQDLMKELQRLFQVLSEDLQVYSLKELDENFHPILKAFAELIVWLFWRENLPANSWLSELKVFSDSQEELEKNLDSKEATLKRYGAVDFENFPGFSHVGNKKEISEEIPKILTAHKVSQPENAQNILSTIEKLLENEAEKNKNNILLTWLEGFQINVITLIRELNQNAASNENIIKIVEAESSKLDALQKLDSQFLALTQSWQVFVRQLATGELRHLNEFLTAIDEVSPSSNIVMDLLQYAVEFGAQAHVKCLVEKYPSHVNIPLSQKEKQPTILLLAYERMKCPDSSDYERVHIFYDLLKRDEININAPNDEGNTLLHLAVARNDDVVINDMLSVETFAINQPNKACYTALCQAVLAKNSAMMNLLLKNGATLGAPEKLDRATMQKLLSFRDGSENTLLHLAVSAQNLHLVKQLFELKGTETEDVAMDSFSTPLINRENSHSETALGLAKKRGSREIVEFLEGKEGVVKSGNRSAFAPVFQPQRKTPSTSDEPVLQIRVDPNMGLSQ